MSVKAGLHVENYTVTENVERTTKDGETGLNNQQESSEGLKMEGLALPFDKRSRNGVIYETDSIKQAAETLVGCPVLFNHDENETIGHIESVEVTDEGLRYQADLNKDRREVESLERGDIPHVSIQAIIEEMDETAETGKVAIKEFLEMSAVTIPGFPETDVETEGHAVMIEKLMGEHKSEEESEDDDEELTMDEALTDHRFEFEPVPELVLYKDKNEALVRAKSLGLSEVHKHDVNGKEFFMAGTSHQEWKQAMLGQLDNEESTSESTSSEPFAGYKDFDECVSQNSDKNDPEAYCAAIKDKTEQAKGLSEAVAGVETQPTEEIANIAGEVLEKIEDPEFDNDDCGTRTGLERANQLENRESLSADTINRMVSFFARHDGNQSVNDDVDSKWEDCGFVAWQLWGGDAGREWAERKQSEIEDAKNEILDGEKSMTEKLEEQVKEQLEQVDEQDFTAAVASMYEELDAEDTASLMEDFTFTGSASPLVEIVADLADVSPEDLMEMLENGSEGMHGDDEEEEEGDMSDDDEDDMEEESTDSETSNKNEAEESSSQQGDKVTEKSKDELTERVESLEEQNEQLQEALEKLEPVEESKQDNPVTESSGDISLNPDALETLSRR